jgi:hypothetical protein
MAKVTKGYAQYRDKPKGDAQCDRCTMFRAPHGCTTVRGRIQPYGWCKYFKRKRS